MSAPKSNRRPAARSQRPKATTVFAAAFLAGAAAAVGLNRTLDVHLAQRQPRVESEPIFVALRSLPQGAPVTVWDVALRDWPKAMLPAAALRPRDSFDGMVLKHAIREGQPILSVQLAKVAARNDSQVAEAGAAPVSAPSAKATPAEQTDLWAPAEVPLETRAETPVENPPSRPIENLTDTLVDAGAAESPAAERAANESTAAEPVVTEPVVVASPAATDIDAAISPAATVAEASNAPAIETVMRYLVVPERIALEADRSFVPPLEQAEPRGAAAEAIAEAAPKHPSSPAQAQAQRGRPDRPAARTSSNRDQQPQRPPRSATGQPTPTKQSEQPSFLRSMMPSLSLGMGSVEPGPKTAAKPESNPEPSPRSTFRGFGLFR